MNFQDAFLNFIYARPVLDWLPFSQVVNAYQIAGFGIIVKNTTDAYAMISTGARCGGHDVHYVYIVKLRSIDDSTIVEIIASNQDYL